MKELCQPSFVPRSGTSPRRRPLPSTARGGKMKRARSSWRKTLPPWRSIARSFASLPTHRWAQKLRLKVELWALVTRLSIEKTGSLWPDILFSYSKCHSFGRIPLNAFHMFVRQRMNENEVFTTELRLLISFLEFFLSNGFVNSWNFHYQNSLWNFDNVVNLTF